MGLFDWGCTRINFFFQYARIGTVLQWRDTKIENRLIDPALITNIAIYLDYMFLNSNLTLGKLEAGHVTPVIWLTLMPLFHQRT